MAKMTQSQQNEHHLGADAETLPTAHEAQRQRRYARTGEYQCQACQAHFMYNTGGPLVCPKCRNKVSDSLLPLYTEDDPGSDEMMSKDEFNAGD
jgi:hypothetical protein